MQTVTKRLQHRLLQVEQRLHLLDGLWIAHLNLDEVIAIIRHEDDPKTTLMARFELSALQADAILDLKLRHLAKLEEIKLRAERDELSQERDELNQILASSTRLRQLIKQELIRDRDHYQSPRRTPLVTRREAQAIKEEDRLPPEDITIILSEKGWVRAAKGLDVDGKKLNYKTGDAYLAQAAGRSNQPVIFFDNEGKVYSLPAHALPTARGQGEPLTGKLNPADGAAFVALISGKSDQFVLLCTSAGYGFISPLNELIVKTKNGKTCLKLSDTAYLLAPQLITQPETQSIACVSNSGRLLILKANELPLLTRGRGTKLINISKAQVTAGAEYLLQAQVLHHDSTLIIHAGKRHLSLKGEEKTPYINARGHRGQRLPRGFQNVTQLEVMEKS